MSTPRDTATFLVRRDSQTVLEEAGQAVQDNHLIQGASEENRYLYSVPAASDRPGSEGNGCPLPSNIRNDLGAIVEDQNRLRCIL